MIIQSLFSLKIETLLKSRIKIANDIDNNDPGKDIVYDNIYSNNNWAQSTSY